MDLSDNNLCSVLVSTVCLHVVLLPTLWNIMRDFINVTKLYCWFKQHYLLEIMRVIDNYIICAADDFWNHVFILTMLTVSTLNDDSSFVLDTRITLWIDDVFPRYSSEILTILHNFCYKCSATNIFILSVFIQFEGLCCDFSQKEPWTVIMSEVCKSRFHNQYYRAFFKYLMWHTCAHEFESKENVHRCLYNLCVSHSPVL